MNIDFLYSWNHNRTSHLTDEFLTTCENGCCSHSIFCIRKISNFRCCHMCPIYHVGLQFVLYVHSIFYAHSHFSVRGLRTWSALFCMNIASEFESKIPEAIFVTWCHLRLSYEKSVCKISFQLKCHSLFFCMCIEQDNTLIEKLNPWVSFEKWHIS